MVPPLGLFFDIPLGWHAEFADNAYVLSGPAGTPSYYTTVVLRQYDLTPMPALDTLLVSSYAPLPAAEQPTFIYREPTVLAGVMGLGYALQINHLDTPFHRMGAIVPVGEHLLDISCNAPEDRFAAATLDFATVLDSMTFVLNK